MWLILLALIFPQEGIDNLFNRLSEKNYEGLVMIISLSTKINPAKDAKIQYLLLQGNLDSWNEGYTPRQITIISMLTFHKTIGLLEKKIKRIEKIEEPDEKQVKGIFEAEQFIEKAKEIVEKDFEKLGEIADYDLVFSAT